MKRQIGGRIDKEKRKKERKVREREREKERERKRKKEREREREKEKAILINGEIISREPLMRGLRRYQSITRERKDLSMR